MWCSLVLALTIAQPAPAESWRYVVPEPGKEFEHPPLRLLHLEAKRPDDLKESVRYRGSRQRYGQIRFGSPNSIRVTVVLDEVGPNDVDLYIDANRRRRIDSKDLVPGKDGLWRVPLDVEITETKVKDIERTLLFRYGKAARTLSYATCGYLEGRVRLGDDDLAVRRVDGNGNGLFGDADDRVWIDLDKDGRWDELQEQFLCAPILTLRGTRYAVRTDAIGTRLAFEKLTGTGTIRIEVPQLDLAKRIVDLSATLVGRDGSVATLKGNHAEAVLPTGDYRMSVLVLTLAGADGGLPWNYVFSDSGDRQPKWYAVAKDGTRNIDPVGKLELRPGRADDAPPAERRRRGTRHSP